MRVAPITSVAALVLAMGCAGPTETDRDLEVTVVNRGPLPHPHGCASNAAPSCPGGPAAGAANVCWREVQGRCASEYRQGTTLITTDAELADLLADCELAFTDPYQPLDASLVDLAGGHVLVLGGLWIDPPWCGGRSDLGGLALDGDVLTGGVAFGPADCDALIGDFTSVRGAVVDAVPPVTAHLDICFF